MFERVLNGFRFSNSLQRATHAIPTVLRMQIELAYFIFFFPGRVDRAGVAFGGLLEIMHFQL